MAPRWFNRKATAPDKSNYKFALVNFILDQKLRENLPKPGVIVCKRLIHWVRNYDEKWQDVTAENFNTSQYMAHADFSVIIRNLLNSQHELNKMLEIAEQESADQKEASKSHLSQIDGEQPEPQFGSTDQILNPNPNVFVAPNLPDSSGQPSAAEGHASQLPNSKKRSKLT